VSYGGIVIILIALLLSQNLYSALSLWLISDRFYSSAFRIKTC